MVTKHEVEKLIVVRPGVAVPTPGDTLFNATTKVFNQPVGGIGAYIDAAGSGNPVALNPATFSGQPFRFIQVRDRSGDNSPLYNRVLEQSQYIHGNCSLGLELGGQTYTTASNSSVVLGAPNAVSTGNIAVTSNNLYTLNVSAHGYRTDMFNSVYNTPTRQGRFTSPDWATTSYATTNNRRDYTVKALVQDFNRQVSVGQTGQSPIAVALALDTAGTTSTGVTLASVIAGGAGATITIGYDFNCNPVNLLITDGILQAITELEALFGAAVASGGFNIAGGTVKIAPYALPEHCTTGEIAGDGSATADMIYVIALDETPAYYDEIPNTKRRVTASVNQGSSSFTSVRSTTASEPSEGEGMARNLELMFKDVEDYKSYTSSRQWGANHVAYPNEILSGEVYDVFTIHHCHNRTATSGMPSESTLFTAIAVVNTERTVGTSTFSTGVTNPQKTYIRGILDAVAAHYGIQAVTI